MSYKSGKRHVWLEKDVWATLVIVKLDVCRFHQRELFQPTTMFKTNQVQDSVS